MVAEICSAFPQISWDNVLNDMGPVNVISYFHLARFAKHGISVPKVFKDVETRGSKETIDIKTTHRHDPIKGWVRK